jgi:hypothetical protein
MSALFLGFVFTLVLIAVLIVVTVMKAVREPEHHGPLITDADALPRPPHRRD